MQIPYIYGWYPDVIVCSAPFTWYRWSLNWFTNSFLLCKIMDVLKLSVSYVHGKISQNTSFLWFVYSRIKTESNILSLYRNISIRRNSSSGIYYTLWILIHQQWQLPGEKYLRRLGPTYFPLCQTNWRNDQYVVVTSITELHNNFCTTKWIYYVADIIKTATAATRATRQKLKLIIPCQRAIPALQNQNQKYQLPSAQFKKVGLVSFLEF